MVFMKPEERNGASPLRDSIVSALFQAHEEKEMWEKRKLEAEERLEALSQVMEKLKDALNSYTEGALPPSSAPFSHLSKESFEGMTLKQVLIFLARMGGGRLKGRDAVNVVMRSGLIPNRKSADAQIYTMLNREPDFLRLGPGEYQLAKSLQELVSEDSKGVNVRVNDDVDDLPF
jgi:hypothetical protein